jgi:DNA modification methylase
MIRVLDGDMRDVVPTLDRIDAVVTDPPYHLTNAAVRELGHPSWNSNTKRECGARKAGFMGKEWDGGDIAFQPDTWWPVFTALKPGGHLVAFGGTRTFHRLVCAIEDAGFEIRDTLMWLYGSGFPKSHNISAAIDRTLGAEREVVGTKLGMPGYSLASSKGGNLYGGGIGGTGDPARECAITAPATPEAAQWQGWGSALKPSHEDILIAQRPYDLGQLCGILAQKLMSAICLLPSYVRDADASSWLSRSVFVEGFGSAQWSAVSGCNTPADLCALMATWPSGSAIPSSLNIGLSWLRTLAAILIQGNTSTTEMVSRLTTDLRTLNSLASQITPNTIIQDAIHQLGIGSNASLVGRIFSAAALTLEITRELSVAENAFGADAICSPDGIGQIAPAVEPIVLARKPLEGTLAQNTLKHGVGGLNIDACRVATDESTARHTNHTMRGGNFENHTPSERIDCGGNPAGRWPANVLLDGSDQVLEAFAAYGERPVSGSARAGTRSNAIAGGAVFPGLRGQGPLHNDTGTAARFFYSAKADKADRANSKHPTVKPLDLMVWLTKLVCPPGGTVLDPFAGSGVTAEACMLNGFDCILVEKNPEYCRDIRHRIRKWSGMDTPLFAAVAD